MARSVLVRGGVGEWMLMSKLQILNGTTTRRTSLALTMLTGRFLEPPFVAEGPHRYEVGPSPTFQPPVHVPALAPRRHYLARTVYLSQRHLRDVDTIIEAWQQVDAKRLTRSAVLRRAVEYLRDAVEADPAKCTLEND